MIANSHYIVLHIAAVDDFGALHFQPAQSFIDAQTFDLPHHSKQAFHLFKLFAWSNLSERVIKIKIWDAGSFLQGLKINADIPAGCY